ncbi:complex I NDUFA9 subunit family protein [Gammaproteobacteria bacterium]|jgi:NADH dehydrogenase|nr:complex I NDUFA9 subunit family protein [Gammaproteobacteria bacterium]|tara:strand:- start:113 stop:1078 length:966 start_codon:yes stop_codon:yes gene_type:complete
MNNLVTVYGGSGFIGRYIVQKLARSGYRVRVATRRPNEAIFLKTYGMVGQVEPILCNIRNESSIRNAMLGADAVVNCVGILESVGKNKFVEVQHKGADFVSRIASELGVKKLVHISAIGADIDSKSKYASSKGLGESSVMKNFPGAIILRPSIVFGFEDKFFNRFASMARLSPILPIVGGNTKFQPVYVDDVARAAFLGINNDVQAGIYELGGPEVASFNELMRRMLKIILRRRLIVNLPFWIASLMGIGFDLGKAISLGIIRGPITLDQVLNLKNDNVVSREEKTFKDLGIEPKALEIILSEYLWKYRPAGEFSDPEKQN